MICFLCKDYFTNITSLTVHFKIFHSLTSFSTYTCYDSTDGLLCFQTFSSLAKFKRHINNKHKEIDSIYPSSNINIPSTSTCEPTQSDSYTHNNISTNNDDLKEKDSAEYFNLNKSINSIYKSAIQFVMNLHANNNFTFKDIAIIQTGLKEKLFEPLTNLCKEIVESEIKESSSKSLFYKFSSILSDPFKYCNTEYNLMKWLEQNDYFENIKQFTINNEINVVLHDGEVVYDEAITKGVLLPLRFQFRKFLELNDNFKNMFNKLNSYKNNKNSLFSNFVQGDLWKQKMLLFEGKIVFPFFLYADGVEINNPLGSHSNYQSITAIYYNFPLNENNSTLRNIFVASLVKSEDFKKFGNNLCLTNVINEINFLETEGITVVTPDGEFKVYFVLGLLLGDNLGVNSLLEFPKSFSASYFCRFCKANKLLTKHMSVEDSSLIRTADNYSVDVSKTNFKETGIYQESILNSIKTFHVTTNYCVDVMHDLFEGVCHYNMCHIIKYYTETTKLFSLDCLNNRKVTFNYGSIEVGNISPPILDSHIKNSRLKMSAREMWTFVHFFSLMVGDLIPCDDEVWEFYINFLKMIDILLSYSLTESSISLLQQLIKIHNEKYVFLFNDTLKPKFHFLVHYPTIIKQSGPPRHFWCFRFEGKHRELKTYARVTSSRKNITLSISKKFQLKFSNLIMQSSIPDITGKDKDKIISEEVTNAIFTKMNLSPVHYSVYTEVQYKGITYKKKLYLSKFINAMFIFEIKAIILVNNTNQVFILAKKIALNYFSSHYQAYEVFNDLQIVEECSLLNINEFSGPPLNITKTCTGKMFIRLKEFS